MCFCRALPNCAPSHSQSLSPTSSHSHPLPPIFQEKRHTPTHVLTKTTHSHPIFKKSDPLPPSFNKNNPILPIFHQIGPTPTDFSTKTTHSHHSHPFFHQSSTKTTCIHQFSNYNRLSIPVTIKALNELGLENIIFEYSTSEKKWKAYFSKSNYICQYYYTWNMEGNISHISHTCT